MFAGGMVVVLRTMYENLGTRWTCTVLVCLVALLVPDPFVLFKWGSNVRAISRFTGKREMDDGAEDVSEEDNDPMQEIGSR